MKRVIRINESSHLNDIDNLYIEFDIQNRQTGKSTYLLNELRDQLSLGNDAAFIHKYPRNIFTDKNYSITGLENYIFNLNVLNSKLIGSSLDRIFNRNSDNRVLNLLIDEFDFYAVEFVHFIHSIVELNSSTNTYDYIHIHTKTTDNTKFHKFFLDNGFSVNDLDCIRYVAYHETHDNNRVYKLALYKYDNPNEYYTNSTKDYVEYTCESYNEFNHIIKLYWGLFSRCHTNINYMRNQSEDDTEYNYTYVHTC